MSKVNKFGFPMIPEYEYLVPDNFWSYTKVDQVKCLLKAIDSFLPDAPDVDESDRSEGGVLELHRFLRRGGLQCIDGFHRRRRQLPGARAQRPLAHNVFIRGRFLG